MRAGAVDSKASVEKRIAELEKENDALAGILALYVQEGKLNNARIAELEKENEKLKKENKEYKGVEQFIMERFGFRVVKKENSDEDDDEDSDDEEEVLEDLTCAQLKQRLRAINKPVGGRKADLIKRIRDHERLTAALFEED